MSSILAVSHSISLINKHLTLTFSPLSCWCKILSQLKHLADLHPLLHQPPWDVTVPGFHSTPVFEVSILLSTLCLQKPLSPTVIFSFAKFSSVYHFQWFLNFSFKTNKETTQLPLFHLLTLFLSPHVILPLPKGISSLLLPAEFHIIPTSPPSQISLYLSQLFWFSLFPLYPFPVSLQLACTVNQDIRMLC